jgi:hypothetical protein
MSSKLRTMADVQAYESVPLHERLEGLAST